jgi:hypothetical protein
MRYAAIFAFAALAATSAFGDPMTPPGTTEVPTTTVYDPTKPTGEMPMMTTTAASTETKEEPLCGKPNSTYAPYPRENGEEDKMYLLLVEAGTVYVTANATHLKGGEWICPDNYGSGYSIVCDVPYDTKSVDFEVDGKYKRTEKVPPFAIQSDKRGIPRRWRVKNGARTVRCVADYGAEVSIDVNIGCGPQVKQP